MAKNGKLNFKNLLQNRIVLYIVLIFSILSLINFATNKDWNSLTFFLVVGFLTQYFSKNMIIVLLVALGATYLCNKTKVLKEGMKTAKKSTKEGITSKDPKREKVTEKVTEKLTTLKPARIDKAASMDASVSNLMKNIDMDGIKAMTQQTKDLMDQQKQMMGALTDMAPQVKDMMNMMGGQKGLESLLQKFGGAPQPATENEEK